VTAIVFDSFELELATLKNLFFRLIKEETIKTIECLITDLIIFDENGLWLHS
jgi:hypothetical protein